MKTLLVAAVLSLLFPGETRAAEDRVDTKSGPLVGTIESDGLRVYKGIPYAAPPVGRLRWQPPQPVAAWKEVRQAAAFGARCMQRQEYADMVFRTGSMSEDCLFLNVWTPAKTGRERLPVLVYFYGGGFRAGDGSEARYDGAAMARRGIVALTVNYRLAIFGFLAHPELTSESPAHASGNYGLLDQVAALRWVRDNIAEFGGDPGHVTIAGESAGSISVSALMASPLSRGLIAGAIGESGAAINPTFEPVALAEAEKVGVAFAVEARAESLDNLRAMSAEALLAVQGSGRRVSLTLDGYVLPKSVAATFKAGEQAHVPLLAGWNSQENPPSQILGTGGEATPDHFATSVRVAFPERADDILKYYSGSTSEEITDAAIALASDRFIAFSTWKWIDLHARSGGNSTFRYYYSRPRPAMNPGKGSQGPARGASHSAEIEYALGNLAGNEVYNWTDADRTVSDTMSAYFANFVKTGNPNGGSLPKWPAIKEPDHLEVMHIDVDSRAEPDRTRARYLLLDEIYSTK